MGIINLKDKFSSRVSSKHILALSWKIATDPELYWQLAPNPYTPKALQIISEKFPNENASNVVKAVILAEPEGKYDRNLAYLEATKHKKGSFSQENASTRFNKKIKQYHYEYKRLINLPPKNIVYEKLFKAAFETNDIKKPELLYSQNQRLYLKLVIVDFIENEYRKSKSTMKILVVILAILVSLYFFVIKQLESQTIVRNQESNIQASEINNIETQKVPIRLIIPAINVNTAIQNVGVTANGEMGVPNNYTEVGWLNLSTIPGQKGSAVMAGHVDGNNGERGVFADLYKLKPGDKIFVEYGNSDILSFIVRKYHIYNAGYADEVFDDNNSSHLNLITCSGLWDKERNSFSERLVVFTDLIN